MTAFAVVMAALIGVAGFGSVALAQQAQEGGFPEFSTYELFAEPDSVDPKPDVIRQLADAIRKAQAPGDCPLGRLKIRAPEGDPLFQPSLAAARRDAVLMGYHHTKQIARQIGWLVHARRRGDVNPIGRAGGCAGSEERLFADAAARAIGGQPMTSKAIRRES